MKMKLNQYEAVMSQAADRMTKLRAALEKTLDTLRIYSYTEYLDAREAREALEAK